MKKMIFLIIFIFLLTGCTTFKENREKYLRDKEIIEGKKEVKIGMDKKEVEEICGENYKIYKSETEMMEVWIYENWFVGFDKNGKVIKFKIFERVGREWKE